MKMNQWIILILIMFCNISCDKLVDHVFSIKIQNNTNDTIQFYESYNYPDTSIVVSRARLKMAYPLKYSFLDSKKDWNEVLVPPKDTISIFIFSKDTVDRYTWDKIRSDYNILKRYDLSLEDLQDMNWTITYP